MKGITTTIFFFLTLAVLGQVNDAEAFFNGSYDKAFIRKHKIRQITVESFIEGKKISVSQYHFDKKGLLTIQNIFDSTGKKVSDYKFNYDVHGGQVERKNFDYDLNKSYAETFTKTYQGSNLVFESSSYLPFVTKHVYNKEGKRIESTTFLGTDTSTSARRLNIYSYDDKGRLKNVRESFVEHHGAEPFVTGNSEYIYDTTGNVSAVFREGKANYELTYGSDGLLKTKTVTMPEEFNGMNIIDKFSYKFW